MKKLLLFTAIAAIVIAIPVSNVVWGKAHVPVDQVQVCHAGKGTGATTGKTITVDAPALAAHLRHGDCQLPACDFNNIFFNDDLCERIDAGDDGRCDVPNARDNAGGVTPACPPGAF